VLFLHQINYISIPAEKKRLLVEECRPVSAWSHIKAYLLYICCLLSLAVPAAPVNAPEPTSAAQLGLTLTSEEVIAAIDSMEADILALHRRLGPLAAAVDSSGAVPVEGATEGAASDTKADEKTAQRMPVSTVTGGPHAPTDYRVGGRTMTAWLADLAAAADAAYGPFTPSSVAAASPASRAGASPGAASSLSKRRQRKIVVKQREAPADTEEFELLPAPAGEADRPAQPADRVAGKDVNEPRAASAMVPRDRSSSRDGGRKSPAPVSNADGIRDNASVSSKKSTSSKATADGIRKGSFSGVPVS
jgi:hypothetical protein